MTTQSPASAATDMHDQSQLDDVLVMTASIIHDAAIMQSMARTSGRVPSIESVRRLYQSVQVLAMVCKRRDEAPNVGVDFETTAPAQN
jgi:hypothetical protein